MKLTPELKEKIDKYFNNVDPQELCDKWEAMLKRSFTEGKTGV